MTDTDPAAIIAKHLATLRLAAPAASRPRDDSRPKAEDTLSISRRFVSTNQLRAARALLGWDQVMLAQRAGVSTITLKRIERGTGNPHEITLSKVTGALTAAGILVVKDGNGGIGVLLRQSATAVGPSVNG
jgi:DNA-binding XRE family transcriptional regulator